MLSPKITEKKLFATKMIRAFQKYQNHTELIVQRQFGLVLISLQLKKSQVSSFTVVRVFWPSFSRIGNKFSSSYWTLSWHSEVNCVLTNVLNYCTGFSFCFNYVKLSSACDTTLLQLLWIISSYSLKWPIVLTELH